MEERRKYPRYGCHEKRRLIAKYEGKNRILGQVIDFSRSGISFASKSRLKKDKEVKLDLHISGLSQKMPATIQVVWIGQKSGEFTPLEKTTDRGRNSLTGFTYGARLVSLSPSSKFDILDLLFQDWRNTLKTSPALI